MCVFSNVYTVQVTCSLHLHNVWIYKQWIPLNLTEAYEEVSVFLPGVENNRLRKIDATLNTSARFNGNQWKTSILLYTLQLYFFVCKIEPKSFDKRQIVHFNHHRPFYFAKLKRKLIQIIPLNFLNYVKNITMHHIVGSVQIQHRIQEIHYSNLFL